jgi:5-methylcytosine-specific restriction endonuclease McrA
MPGKRTIPRTCEQCGKDFLAWSTKPNAKFCSNQCKFTAAKKGRKPYVWPKERRLTRPRVCEQCGKAFLASAQAVSLGKGRFCSRQCYGASIRTALVDRTCDECGKSFQVYPHVVRNGGGHFCSRSCSAKSKRGPLSCHWQGGITSRRVGAAHHRWSSAVKDRDNRTCQRCGKKGGRLHAHHIQSYRRHPELAFVVSNGITLCHDCHWDVHRGKPLQLSLIKQQISTS